MSRLWHVVLRLAIHLAASLAQRDEHYDCPTRQMAFDYAGDIVLSRWASGRANEALKLVHNGLNGDQCNLTSPIGSKHTPMFQPPTKTDDTVVLYVSPDGNDNNSGAPTSPLKTVQGARSLIRKRYSEVSKRPQITVAILPGEYFFGEDTNNHLGRAKEYSDLSMTTFTEEDSGSSPTSPIVYTAAAGAGTVQFIGGMLLDDLSWATAGAGYPTGAIQAHVPGTVDFDAQDQLFVYDTDEERHPLVRGRTPNGKPWIPLDGYNLSVAATSGFLAEAEFYSSCEVNPSPPPQPKPGRPPNPPPGACLAVANYTFLNGIPLPHPILTNTAADCLKACQLNSCCKGFTWHDITTGPYYQQCYLLTALLPNDDPWYHAAPYAGHQSGFCNHSNVSPKPRCGMMPTSICATIDVVCKATNVSQVTGVMGIQTESSKTLAGNGVVQVDACLEHLLDIANDWPDWKAQSYGVYDQCSGDNVPPSCVNTLDTTYNFPLWFGPWAGQIAIDQNQDAGTDLKKFKWNEASSMVVHAMADGEWGGVQFHVSDATINQSGSPILTFDFGGFQQARGATLSEKNRFYVEGAAEFVDSEGEWHFDATTRLLTIVPPRDVVIASMPKVLLTQTDTLIQFLGSSSADASRVKNIVVSNITFGYTSAQFFRPHEETSGGDYATHRSGAIKIENATGLNFIENNFTWIGGNGIFLSNSVRNVTVYANLFQFLGTSGVAMLGKTGVAMMDGRDGELLIAKHGPDADNGVRLPTSNLVAHNVFANYGVWDKQSACFHKALAPNNVFLNNICFNSSRHGVNFQDGFGGGGIAEGNVFFNLNRETSDTTALNAWNRRNYVTSSSADPAVGVLVPEVYNEWRRNLVIGRDFYGIRDGNGDGLRNDDGSSYYLHSNNVLVYAGIQFNGGTQIWAKNNLMINCGWHLGPTPDAAQYFNNTVVGHSENIYGNCIGFWNESKPGTVPGIYTGDFSIGISNSTGLNDINFSTFYCGYSLDQWQSNTGGQDKHSQNVVAGGLNDKTYGMSAIIERARSMLWSN